MCEKLLKYGFYLQGGLYSQVVFNTGLTVHLYMIFIDFILLFLFIKKMKHFCLFPCNYNMALRHENVNKVVLGSVIYLCFSNLFSKMKTVSENNDFSTKIRHKTFNKLSNFFLRKKKKQQQQNVTLKRPSIQALNISS